MSISRRAVLATAAAALPAVTLLGSVHEAFAAPGTTYYIAEDGDDQATGTSESAPWQSVNKVVAAINAGQIVRGDTILFKRGQTFYGQFTDLSGLQGEGRITFGAYGSGEKPRIMGYKVLNKPEAWKNIGGNQWQIELVEGNYTGNTVTGDANVGFLLLDSAFHGRKKFSVGELSNDLDFHSDERSGVLTVCSETNPSGRGDLRVAVNGRIFQAVTNMTIQDLDLIGCGGHGIQVRDVAGVEVLRNRIRHIGGSTLYGTTRYGNGVEVYLGGSDVLVEDNIIHDVYDVATTIQGNQILKTSRDAPVLRLGSSNVHFRKNYITRCSQSFEIWVAGPEDKSPADTTNPRSGIRGCSFTDNYCEDAGIGSWGQDVRPNPDEGGVHLLSYAENLPIELSITGNQFIKAKNAYMYCSPEHRSRIAIDRNVIQLAAGQKLQQQRSETIEQHAAWSQSTGFDANSTFTVAG
ncbi:right-handed parallel beta-helix repeat-containing protein [[Pseudopropionibacterium] massiliense]|uniref:right-handed parallel beta-helix repeat-containing protein n=1 Tax=[Pseudopropionibacterium] massiliense TaxID=2220000 RepID=UPI00102FD638|nr:right-handed parallel beta-helix repeat-containing protein [[Pseudopropionibacterium] massiliense]